MAVPAAPTLCSERFGSQPPRLYVGAAGGRLVGQHEDTGRMSSSLSSTLSSVFLPQGYPDSVSADYLPYQLWDTVQAFASTITGALATQAVLKGVGVGDGSASVAAASLTWMLKDGTGMIGRILFAWMKGTHLDRDAKQWRLFADLLNDIAIFIEILAPFFPAIFTLVVCVSCIFKAVVGVSGGATRAALTSHQARRDNMADVSAKDGSQETLVNLAGLCTGLLLTPLAATAPCSLTYLLFFLFTSLHIYANVRAVRSVVMETVNRGRLRILLEDFLREGAVPSPPSVNAREPLLPVLWEREQLILGAPLHRVVGSTYELKKATENNTKNYLLGVHKKKGEVCVSLREGSGSLDVLQAAFHAELLFLILNHDLSEFPVEHRKLTELQQNARAEMDDRQWGLVSDTHCVMDELWTPLLRGVSSNGWETRERTTGEGGVEGALGTGKVGVMEGVTERQGREGGEIEGGGRERERERDGGA